MTVESIPRHTVESRHNGMNWRQYPTAVNKPAARLFAYALTASFGLFESVALLMLWRSNATLEDAVYWFLIAGFAALFIGGISGTAAFIDLHNDYVELSTTASERTQTEYRTVKAQPAPATRTMTSHPATPNHITVGKFGFTNYNLTRLARTIANGGTFSHSALADAKVIGDRTTPGNAQKARDVQAELIRLGYAYTVGRNTACNSQGRDWLAPYLPPADRDEFLGSHNQPPPSTTTNHEG